MAVLETLLESVDFHGSLSKLMVLLQFLLSAYILYLVSLVVYNIYFHPLRRFPGPVSFAATPIPFVRYQITGKLPYLYKSLHDKYGDIVRVLPNELSFNTPGAWREIYNNRPGHKFLTKDPKSFAPSSEGAYNIVTVSNLADHSRYRHALNPAFSERALREQEPSITAHIDLLMKRLNESCDNGAQDLVKWFNLAMFDIISELTFGKSLGGLEECKFHPWLEGLLGSAIKYASFQRSIGKFPHISRLLALWVPKTLLEQRVKHELFSKEMVEQRMSSDPGIKDFMSHVLPFDEKDLSLTLPEMRATYGVMMLAGSENLVATLTLTIYYLLRNPEALDKLTHEVRGSFSRDEDITFESINSLKYLSAALTEAMRIQPAAPSSQPRLVPEGGETICGNHIPGGAIVSLPPYCINHDAKNFKDPDSYLPDRWLGVSDYGSEDDKRAFQPFGVGPRSCIGRRLALAEMRLLLAKLFWNFDLKLPNESVGWAEELKVYHLWELTPFLVHLSARK